jgi:hypothetical protein
MAETTDTRTFAQLALDVLTHLFALPAHTVDEALVAKVGALSTHVDEIATHVSTIDGNEQADDAKITGVVGQMTEFGNVLRSFASAPATATVASAPVPDPVAGAGGVGSAPIPAASAGTTDGTATTTSGPTGMSTSTTTTA